MVEYFGTVRKYSRSVQEPVLSININSCRLLLDLHGKSSTTSTLLDLLNLVGTCFLVAGIARWIDGIVFNSCDTVLLDPS
jgi:hypothetical protein